MNKEINFDDLVFIGFYAIGYYSDTEAYKGLIVPSNMEDLVKENYHSDTWYFSEIDGKHSQTPANLFSSCTKEDILDVMYEFDFDKYGVDAGTELLKNNTFDTDAEFNDFCYKIMEFQSELSKYKIKKVTKYEVVKGDDE